MKMEIKNPLWMRRAFRSVGINERQQKVILCCSRKNHTQCSMKASHWKYFFCLLCLDVWRKWLKSISSLSNEIELYDTLSHQDFHWLKVRKLYGIGTLMNFSFIDLFPNFIMIKNKFQKFLNSFGNSFCLHPEKAIKLWSNTFSINTLINHQSRLEFWVFTIWYVEHET